MPAPRPPRDPRVPSRTRAPTRDRTQPGVRHGLARVLSKQGVCSRTEAARWIAEGRVSVDGRIVRDPEWPTDARADRLAIDGHALQAAVDRVYLALNKPRGLVTSAADERGRSTVYAPFEAAALPWVAPVGRLDRASEGLLLFTNDTAWAAAITDPRTHLDKRYHVRIDRLADAALLDALRSGSDVDGERLALKSVEVLRSGERNDGLDVVLDEGRNRHIRRLLEFLGLRVRRLRRIRIGPFTEADLRGRPLRELAPAELARLDPA